MHIIHWCISAVLGLLAGLLLLHILAVLFYALPRAVFRGIQGRVRWGPSSFYLTGALKYAAILLLIVLIAYWLHVDSWGFLFGLFMPILPSLSTLRSLRDDVNKRLDSGEYHDVGH
jgi:hypothetical protein